MNEYVGYPVLFLMNLFLIGLLQIMTVCGLITDNLVTYIHPERNSGLYFPTVRPVNNIRLQLQLQNGLTIRRYKVVTTHYIGREMTSHQANFQ